MDQLLSMLDYFVNMLEKLSSGMLISVLIFALTLLFSLPMYFFGKLLMKIFVRK